MDKLEGRELYRGTILDPAADPLPSKRTRCMVQPPFAYEVGGCPKCQGDNTTWSEYDRHVWCFDCEIDYVPESGGLFDGPIPLGLAKTMGLSFDKIEIATGRIVTVEEQWAETAAVSKP